MIWTGNLPVAEPLVINALPLIYLSRSGHLPLLKILGDEIVVPEFVANEVRAYGPDDVTAKALVDTSWLREVPAEPVPPSVFAWDLGKGESAVLAWALTHPGSEAIIDDLPARRCAVSLQVPLRGTLGLVLLAKQRGAIPLARPVMERLRQAGMYLSDSVMNRALERVAE